jgi:hypothetical protein
MSENSGVGLHKFYYNAPGNVDVYDKEIKAKAVPIKEIV